ncbi:hypothetical protein EVAR_97223_1 [Eumeta japonica]|uniref:Uncharacterized protein n=1 Tax=Eumeta variegata TaxID=151549 RepID=A0A4C1SGU4_EUMVA|nr:hypothetical protein EVAR_97223_1 [Eumeta japonica]
MDLAETMKSVLAKSTGGGTGNASGIATPHAAEGYVIMRSFCYVVTTLLAKIKGWTPSIELLQCFSDLKESSMLSNAAYLQMMASRVDASTSSLPDSQAVERLLRGALPQDYQLPITHLAALTGLTGDKSETRRAPRQALPTSATFISIRTGPISRVWNHYQVEVAIRKCRCRSVEAEQEGGQERVVRAFAELARNFTAYATLRTPCHVQTLWQTERAVAKGIYESRSCLMSEGIKRRLRRPFHPALCPVAKPHPTLTPLLTSYNRIVLLDTIQLVQSLRSYLPPPHIQVTSWKNDDKLR